MLERLVPPDKMKRARAISTKSVLELGRASKDPLVVYCIIQGSDAEPYTAIIDLGEQVVAHWCPDFIKHPSSWCKHLGKLLLDLDPAEVNAVAAARHALKAVVDRRAVQDRLMKCKEQVVLETTGDDGTEELPLLDRIRVACDLVARNDTTGAGKLVAAIASGLDSAFSRVDDRNVAFSMDAFLAPCPATVAGLPGVRDVACKHVARAMVAFTRDFWIASTALRLETAAALRAVARRFTIDLVASGLDRLRFPGTITTGERQDAAIVLAFIGGADGTLDKRFGALPLPHDVPASRYQRALVDLRVAGTGSHAVVEWLEQRCGATPAMLATYDSGDQFLIHVMNAMGERPVYNVSGGFSPGRDFMYHPVKLLEANPTLQWVLDHVKKSEREYITRQEVRDHDLFFTWLAGEDRQTSWHERPRAREVNPHASTGDFIVQWDVNVNRPNEEILCSFHDGRRLVMDMGSPVAAMTQPFDYVLCHAGLVTRADWIDTAKPKSLLVPDQVVELAMHGVQVISSLLPWDVLCSHARHEYVPAAMIDKAIVRCDRNKFVLGSITLKKALASIGTIGRKGLDADAYTAIHDRAVASSGRLNPGTRAVARDVMIAEGTVLRDLLELVAPAEEDKLKIVLRAVIATPSIHAFRASVMATCLQHCIAAGNRTKEFLSLARRDDLGAYDALPGQVSNALNQHLATFKTMLARKKVLHKEAVAREIMGRVVLEGCNLPPAGPVDDAEREAMKQLVESLEAFAASRRGK